MASKSRKRPDLFFSLMKNLNPRPKKAKSQSSKWGTGQILVDATVQRQSTNTEQQPRGQSYLRNGYVAFLK